jgi:hypothetical protein
MTEKKAAIGDKENSPAASNRPKHRSRRVEGELRQRLLKQNFEQQHFKNDLFSAAKEVKEVATSNNNNPQPPNSADADQKQHPVRISCEEKVKQIRHKLEKIVHKREPNESKAIGYLSTLDTMRLTPQVVANTRVDLVIEALTGMAKDSAVVAKAKDSLVRLKAVTEVRDKVTVKDALQYRDPAEEAKKKARKEEAERRRNSPKKYTATSSLLSLVGSEEPSCGNVVGEVGESSVDHLPSMRGLDYWMNKMVSDMAKLDVLGQQVGRIEKVVEIESKQKQQQEQKAGASNQKQQQQKQKEVDMESKQKQQQERKAVEKKAKQKQQQQQQKQKEVEVEAKQKQQQQQGQKEVDMETKQKQQQQQKQKAVEKSRKEEESGRRNGEKGGEKLMAGKGGSKLEEDLLQITVTVGRIAIREETEKIPSVKAR